MKITKAVDHSQMLGELPEDYNKVKLTKADKQHTKEMNSRLKTIKCLKEVSTNEWMIDSFLSQMVVWMPKKEYEQFINHMSDNDCGYDINRFVKHFNKLKKDDWYTNTI
jgi:hypothetical protein